MKIVYIKWGDAWVDGSKDFTETEAELFEPITRTTVGYYVTENHNCLVLATDYYDEEKSYNCPMVIPIRYCRYGCRLIYNPSRSMYY
jgi:hypothetical protein